MTLIPTGKILKHSGKGKLPDKFEYRAYEDKTLCVIAYLKEYVTSMRGWPLLLPSGNHLKELP